MRKPFYDKSELNILFDAARYGRESEEITGSTRDDQTWTRLFHMDKATFFNFARTDNHFASKQIQE